MTIRSLQSIDGIAFGASQSALSHLGAPLRSDLNRKGEDEVVFAEVIYRFVADRLVEVSFRIPPVISIDGQAVEAGSLVAFLKQHDSEFRLAYGFAIAPRLGLAADTEHDAQWATAFVSGRWDHIK